MAIMLESFVHTYINVSLNLELPEIYAGTFIFHYMMIDMHRFLHMYVEVMFKPYANN